ncbi:tRNA (adenosine(37)-N6)-threonylcarbamoyltransferase complex ATPase subunit type 1 TsaE [Candidatus Mycoplasma pogonae]
MKKIVCSEKDLSEVINYLLPLLEKKHFLLLDGEIGAGKTTLVKQIAIALNEKKIVDSPTFNIIKIYDKFVHIDAYKITGDLSEYEDYFDDKVVIIEWAENLELEFNHYLRVEIKILNADQRAYLIEVH